jgi:hypothetical protein
MSGPAEYFPGCEDVPLFELEPAPPVLGPLTPTPQLTLEDAVKAAEARRDCSGGQLALPAELLPVPAGALFA